MVIWIVAPPCGCLPSSSECQRRCRDWRWSPRWWRTPASLFESKRTKSNMPISSGVLKVHFKMPRLVPTCGKNKATKPARQKTTRTQSNAPNTQTMMTWWRRKICKNDPGNISSVVVFYLLQPSGLTSPGSEVYLGLHGEEGEGEDHPGSHAHGNEHLLHLVGGANCTWELKVLRRASHKLTPSYLSANPRREWTVQERSCCGESSFWWRAHTPGRSWGWRRRPWPHRAEMGSPWRTWPHLGWRRTQWSP